MYCPECGNDAGDAKFCPECGANLAGVKEALTGKSPVPAESSAPAAEGDRAAAAGPTASSGGPGRLSPAVIWGGFGALAVVVIVVVVMVSGGFGGGSANGSSASSGATVQPVAADTSGSYSELVSRANDLYDKGDTAFQNQQFDQGGQYFAAAAKVYAAAWKKQHTDPGVGTDYGVALFYSGDINGALKQIDTVLQANPEWQKGWLNKGIFLSHESRIAKQDGDNKAAKTAENQAKQALTKAVALDPKSDAGKQADQALQQLN